MSSSSVCALALLLLAAGGCRLGRYDVAEPVTDRMIEVRSGDRWRIAFDDPSPETSAWTASCPDDHVEVSYERLPGQCAVTVRVHRGFGGPTDVTIRRRDRATGRTVRRVTLGLYSRTGDYAPWR